MSRRNAAILAAAILAVGGFVACSEGAPTTPVATDHMSADVVGTASLDPFTFRAPIDPYKIEVLPDFMIHSKARTDVVFQRIVLSAASPLGMWHTHPGPSFVYVIEGDVKLDRFSKRDGCTSTPTYGPGNTYFEAPNEVHRAVVMSGGDAVILVTRFNIPVGQPFTIMADDPGC